MVLETKGNNIIQNTDQNGQNAQEGTIGRGIM